MTPTDTDLRSSLALAADVLDDLVPRLRDSAEGTDSDAESEAFREALRSSIRLARQLRALTHFAGAGHRPVGARAPEGSRPSAQPLDGTEDTDGFRPE